MDEQAKKTALRMIPYGLYVLTSKSADGGEVSAATVNWVTQASFAPPLVVVGVKADSGAHSHIKESGTFAVNVLGKEQLELAFAFFKPTQREGNKLNGHHFELGPSTGCPIIPAAPAWWECKLVDEVAKGDHTIFVGEVVEAGIRTEDQTILMRDHNLNYGG